LSILVPRANTAIDLPMFFLKHCTFIQCNDLHTSRHSGCHVPFLQRSRAMSDHAMVRHGAFSWCELMTIDGKAATQFYHAILVWSTDQYPQGAVISIITYRM